MARLNKNKWSEVKAAYEVKNSSNRELAAIFGVSETAIRLKAKSECWIKGQTSHLVDKKINIIKELNELTSQTSQLTSQHLTAIDDEVSFKLASNKDLQVIQDKANEMIAIIDSPSHVLALMTATVKHREARLGKSPDVAVQINNNSSTSNNLTFDKFRETARTLLNEI